MHKGGVRVVERLSRSYRLTAEGGQVRDRAKEIETRIADIAHFANTVDPLPNRVVRVNGPPALLSQFLAPRLLPLQELGVEVVEFDLEFLACVRCL